MKDYYKTKRQAYIKGYLENRNEVLGFRSNWDKAIVGVVLVGLSLIGLIK